VSSPILCLSSIAPNSLAGTVVSVVRRIAVVRVETARGVRRFAFQLACSGPTETGNAERGTPNSAFPIPRSALPGSQTPVWGSRFHNAPLRMTAVGRVPVLCARMSFARGPVRASISELHPENGRGPIRLTAQASIRCFGKSLRPGTAISRCCLLTDCRLCPSGQEISHFVGLRTTFAVPVMSYRHANCEMLTPFGEE
jgi:hypothetical protein